MLIPVPTLISNLFRRQPRPARAHRSRHLMLAGINQTVFLSQWGEPEFRISLDNLSGFYDREAVVIRSDTIEEDLHEIWVYKEKDRIFFFSQKKLTSHYKWSEFRDKRKGLEEETDSETTKRTAFLFAKALSMVA
jgi:hypothetical protein